jgi:hypothetical protein
MERILPLLYLIVFLAVLYFAYKKVMEYVPLLTPFEVTYTYSTSSPTSPSDEIVTKVYANTEADVEALLYSYVRNQEPPPRTPPKILEVRKLDYSTPGVAKFVNRTPVCSYRVGNCFYNFNQGSGTKYVRAPCRPPVVGFVETLIANTPGLVDTSIKNVQVTFEGCNKPQ